MARRKGKAVPFKDFARAVRTTNKHPEPGEKTVPRRRTTKAIPTAEQVKLAKALEADLNVLKDQFPKQVRNYLCPLCTKGTVTEENGTLTCDYCGTSVPCPPPSHDPLQKVDEVIAERGKVYGSNPYNQITVGKMWTAILESHFQTKLPGDIPPHIVALMMVGLKIMRASTPFGYNDDNFTDAHGYLKIARICDARAPKDE